MATENKSLSHYDKSQLPDAAKLRIGLVVSEWNEKVTDSLYNGARDTLIDCGVQKNNIGCWKVPGSFELAYGCKEMIRLFCPDAVIAVGSIVRGETPHFDYVCTAVTQGITQLNLTSVTPIVFCVLTDNSMQQAIDRSGGKHGNKGVEAAVTAIKMACLKQTNLNFRL